MGRPWAVEKQPLAIEVSGQEVGALTVGTKMQVAPKNCAYAGAMGKRARLQRRVETYTKVHRGWHMQPFLLVT